MKDCDVDTYGIPSIVMTVDVGLESPAAYVTVAGGL